MKTHLVQHPKLTRQELHGHTIAQVRKHLTIRKGRLTASESEADGRYVLAFQANAFPDPKDVSRPWTPVGEPRQPDGTIIVPQAESLDQATVARIRVATPQDCCDTDFVLDL